MDARHRFGPLRARGAAVTDVAAHVARLLDAAILWRLGLIDLDEGTAPPPAEGRLAVDPAAFWATTSVLSPPALRADPVEPRAERRIAVPHRGIPRAARLLELTGPSRGPGTHWGASHLRAHVVLHPDPGAPLALLLHGYAVPAPWWEELQAWQLFRRGVSSARLELPFHMSRRMTSRSSPGAGFFSSDLARTASVVAQSVEDAAAVVAWARAELGADVGVVGTSLGGLVGSLVAANVRVDSAVLITPACDLVEIMLEYAPTRLRRRLELLDGGGGAWGEDSVAARRVLGDILAPLVPRHLAPVTAPDRMVILLAEIDRVVGADTVRQLADAWGVECWSTHRGHASVLMSRGLMARIVDRVASDLGATPAATALAG